jgi:streptogramin lyase
MQQPRRRSAGIMVGGTLVVLATLMIAGRIISGGLGAPVTRQTTSRSTPTVSTPSTTVPVVPVVATVQVGAEPTQVAVGADGVWVGVWATGKLVRIDPASNRVEATIAVPGGSQLWEIASSNQSVWVGNASGRLWRLDPRRNQVTATIKVPQTNGASASGIGHLAAGAGAIWAGGDGQLLRLDSRNGHLLASIPWAAGTHSAYSA